MISMPISTTPSPRPTERTFVGTIAIAIMCKTPAAGRSKTRLSPPLAPADCAAISACFIRDLAQTIDGMASSYEDPAAVVKWYYENPQQLQQIEGMCLEDEAVNWIAGRARVSEQAVAFDALMNPVQTGNQT